MSNVDELLRELPPDIRQEVADFVEFLLAKRAKTARRSPTFSWAGALRDMGQSHTSVQLQHEITEWRIGGT